MNLFLFAIAKIGQISPQRCILQVSKYRQQYKDSVDVFLEEAIVRRELSDNFCFYNKQYDSIKGAASWAQQSLDIHRKDKREWVYTVEQLEQAKTHDDLWNAAQIQLCKEGKMHGFLRMYWAKKILEWSDTPENALSAAIYLNDYYSLDGRDPNGYVGSYSHLFCHSHTPQKKKTKPLFHSMLSIFCRLHVVDCRNTRSRLGGAADIWKNTLHEL